MAGALYWLFMNRAEFVQRLVLNAICDDFENVDQVILPEVAEQGSKCWLKIDRAEVVAALTALVHAGMAKAYDLGTDRTYFYSTESGRALHQSDAAWWPFDDEGELRRDWSPPGP